MNTFVQACVEEKSIRTWVVDAFLGMVTLHVNVLTPDRQQREVVRAELWNCLPIKPISQTVWTSETSGVHIPRVCSHLTARVGVPSVVVAIKRN